MLAPKQSRQALTRLFQRQSITDLATLSAALETSSRTSVFRRLSARGRLSSYSHAGRTHPELHAHLQVGVHNTLLDLVEGRRIGRQTWRGHYLYVSANPARAASQLGLRQQPPAGLLPPLPEPPAAVVIEVLLALVRSARVRPDAHRVAERLAARGLPVTVEQVEAIFSRYGLKRTAPSRSPHWRS